MSKKFLSFSCLLACSIMAHAGTNNRGTDRQVNAQTRQQQTAPDMAIAANGWIYNAYQSGDSIAVKISRDQGNSWQHFTSLYADGETYAPPAIAVAGTTASGIHLFVAGLRTAKEGSGKKLVVRRFNAITAAFEAEPLLQTVEGDLHSYDIATDGDAVSKGTDGFSVALVYAASGAADSIIERVSADGGLTFPVAYTVATGNQHFRNVSVCYGRSITASNGRYFMAWDAYNAGHDAQSKVYTSHSATTVLSAPVPPVRIDNLSIATAGRARKPVIAVATGPDNDSASCTAIVLMEVSVPGSATAIYSAANKRPHFSNSWQQTKLSPAGASCMLPALVFDAASQTFAACYFHTGNGSIPVLQSTPAQPGAWTTVTANVADEALQLPAGACLAAGASPQGWVVSWSGKGRHIYFDMPGSGQPFATPYSEDIAAGLLPGEILRLYPNPAVQELYLALREAPPAGAGLRIYNLAGKEVMHTAVLTALTRIAIHTLPAGSYIAVYQDGVRLKTVRFTRLTQ